MPQETKGLKGWKDLSRRTKIGIGIGAGAGALVILAAALAIWQPWKPAAPPADGGQDGPGQPQKPQQTETEEPTTLRVGNKEIPCTIYEGDGWSLYVPEGWETEEDGGTVRSRSPEGLSVSVWQSKDTSAYPAATFASVYDAEGERCRMFYVGDGQAAWILTCSAPAAAWTANDALFRAMARTAGLGEDTPFRAWSPMPDEPDWQKVDGGAVLFMDKDGVPLEDGAEKAVRARMLDLPAEVKEALDGKYRFDLEWCASYTGLEDTTFVDVFRAEVSYRVKDGAELQPPEGQTLLEGWLYEEDTLYLAVSHDGSRVDRSPVLWLRGTGPEDVGFAEELTWALWKE